MSFPSRRRQQHIGRGGVQLVVDSQKTCQNHRRVRVTLSWRLVFVFLLGTNIVLVSRTWKVWEKGERVRSPLEKMYYSTRAAVIIEDISNLPKNPPLKSWKRSKIQPQSTTNDNVNMSEESLNGRLSPPLNVVPIQALKGIEENQPISSFAFGSGVPIPLPPLTNTSTSFCLLIKDDNNILSEWIAYHYHLWNLRHLIVAVDPSSTTSPISILKVWKEMFGLEFQIWTDHNFLPPFFLEGKYDMVPTMIKSQDSNANKWQDNVHQSAEELQQKKTQINNHRYRQAKFLQHCARHLQIGGKEGGGGDRENFKGRLHSQAYQKDAAIWITHIDTDEYMTLNPSTTQEPVTTHQDPNMSKRLPLANAQIYSNGGGLLHALERSIVQNQDNMVNWPCISMPRILYGSREEDDATTALSSIPSLYGWNQVRFESLRWKYHAPLDDRTTNKQPKVIMDVVGFPPINTTRRAFSIHRPSLQLCRMHSQMQIQDFRRYPIVVRHYLGSYERYMSRQDPRRTRALYDEAQLKAGSNGTDLRDNTGDGIEQWLPSFVASYGMEKVSRVLADYRVAKDIAPLNQNFSAPEMNNGASSDSLNVFDASQHADFSACLLVKDDNHILNEWIAYHYHALGLRYLIVAVDPTSSTSPTTLFDQWRAFGMTIEEWQDTDFMPEIFFQKAYHLQPRLVKIKKNKHKWLEGIEDQKVKEEYIHSIQDHRFRPITFLSSCAQRFRDLGRTWVIHIDTDEYVVVNPKLRQQGRFRGGNASIKVPSKVDESIVLRLLNKMVLKSGSTINYPCISLPRVLFGSSIDDSEGPSTVPQGFNQSQFESLRWKYHAEFDDNELSKPPKVIMDVSAIPSDDKMFVDGRVFSIHRPSQELCRNQGQVVFEYTEDFPFSINHYLGTFERFSSRSDPRRNRKLYDQKASIRARKDDDHWVDSWLPSFIAKHGEETVSELLQDYRSNQ